MFPAVGNIKGAVVEPVGDNLLPDLDSQSEKGFAVVLDGDIEPDAPQKRIGVEIGFQLVQPLERNGNLGIDALVGDINTAQDLQSGEIGIKRIAEVYGIIEPGIGIKRQRIALAGVLGQFPAQFPAIDLVVKCFYSFTEHFCQKNAFTGQK